ncbi:MAG: NUDIX hydrolase [Deltaproteobacteria bacterium]
MAAARFERIRSLLSGRVPGLLAELPPSELPPRAAAVLVPLCERDGEPYLVLTKRTESLSNHPGDISFPGGSRDPRDPDLLATALRETHEELGLRPEDVDILGPLDLCDTITRFRVAPFVGVMPWPYELRPAAGEVAKVLCLPVRGFLADGALRIDRREVYGLLRDVYHYTVEGELVWGATGRIVHHLLELVGPSL